MNPLNDNRTRRQFLGEASCASAGSVAAMSCLLNLKMMGTLSASEGLPDEDYKALVCVFLAGGNDSYNMLSPATGDGYSEYAAARGSLALDEADFITLSGALPDGRVLGVDGNMTGIASLYESGKAAFIANVGTLVEYTTPEMITAGTAKLPLGLFSHSDQQLHWQSGMPDTRSPESGWGGRLADLLKGLNEVSGVSMNISTAGTNVFQGSEGTAVFTKRVGQIPEITNWESPTALNVSRRQSVEQILAASRENIFEQALVNRTQDAIAASAEYRTAVESLSPLTTPFTASNGLSLQLKDVAEAICARGSLGKRRQTFFVQVGGWDHHAGLSSHPAQLGELSQAIEEFQAAMVELGLEDKVTLFTASDFGRTLTQNGSGSDHAWGGNQFVVGGAVNGGAIYGDYPSLAIGSVLDTGRGRLIPTTSVDQYIAELALWMGVSPSNLGQIVPNIGRFYDVTSGELPIGFLPSV